MCKALVGAQFKQPGFHVRALSNVFKGPTFTADAVAMRDGFLVGAETTYDLRDGQIKGYNAAVGYTNPEYAVTIHGCANT